MKWKIYCCINNLNVKLKYENYDCAVQDREVGIYGEQILNVMKHLLVSLGTDTTTPVAYSYRYCRGN